MSKTNTKRRNALSTGQIRATRLNNLEHHHLEQHVNLMNDDLQIHLARLKRQAQEIRYHYTNVVRVISLNPAYKLWKQVHAYEIAQDEAKNSTESMKLGQKSESKMPSAKPVRPLLLLLDNAVKNPVEPIIDFGEISLRRKTSTVEKHLLDQQRKSPLLTMLNEHPMRSPRAEYGPGSILPSIKSSGPRKSEQSKLIAGTNTQNMSNLTAYKSVEQTHIVKQKLLDREFAKQHGAFKGTLRPAGLVK